eukprot:TRINITY_DN8435_c0_g1_i6.p3 TRINITY_DN8435_c0_g1~~TRINITY_DN8435_c0_g1_i6.p3  ORF type:complete len:179 (+),score=46.10 TRINITY_DN8435_c0_g1_i6:825-1361(+)
MVKRMAIMSVFMAEASGATMDTKATIVKRLLEAKEASNKSFDDIAEEIGVTNVYAAQLFHGQAQLKPATAQKLKAALPQLSDELLREMQKHPNRSFDPLLLQEPHVYRLHEAVMHNAQSLKVLVNEKFGDGIMSAIDFYCTLDKAKGVHGEDRVVITFNGKFLPFNEQLVEDNIAAQK